jgi:hypothetical protein
MYLRGSLIVAAVCGLLASTALAQEELARWFDPRLGQLKVSGSLESRYECQEHIKQQDRSFQTTRYRAKVLVPIYQDEVQEAGLRATVGAWDIDTDAILPDTGESFPDALWDLSVGGFYRRKLENDWILGGLVNVGSPSDEPFDSAEEVAVDAAAVLNVPGNEQLTWLFYVQYSNHRSFLQHIPLPGAAVLWQPDETFRWVIGMPFTHAEYKPLDWLELEAAYALLRTVHAKVTVRPIRPVGIYAGFDWDNESFFRADRADDDDRLFYYEKRVTAGVRWDISKHVYVDAYGGYAFDRMYFEGEEYDDRGNNRLSIADGLFTGVRAGVRF